MGAALDRFGGQRFVADDRAAVAIAKRADSPYRAGRSGDWLRHPRCTGLRTDKPATDVVRETR